jgi:Uma2 family endonuclease
MASPTLGAGRVTRERYWRLVETGVIGPDDRVELLDGVIVAMSPQNPPHASVVAKLVDRLFNATIDAGMSLRIQMPLELGELSVPEPDLALVPGRPEDYAVAHPASASLVIEVADTTVLQDRLTKGPMYAAAGIAEYWLVNLRARTVEVYRDPIPEQRRYATTLTARRDDRVTLAAIPAITIAVAEILPPG